MLSRINAELSACRRELMTLQAAVSPRPAVQNDPELTVLEFTRVFAEIPDCPKHLNGFYFEVAEPTVTQERGLKQKLRNILGYSDESSPQEMRPLDMKLAVAFDQAGQPQKLQIIRKSTNEILKIIASGFQLQDWTRPAIGDEEYFLRPNLLEDIVIDQKGTTTSVSIIPTPKLTIKFEFSVYTSIREAGECYPHRIEPSITFDT